jgi:hypothetical protein
MDCICFSGEWAIDLLHAQTDDIGCVEVVAKFFELRSRMGRICFSGEGDGWDSLAHRGD